MIWKTYLSWAKLDPVTYGTMPISDRWIIVRHTARTAFNDHHGEPVLRWVRRHLPASFLLGRLEMVKRRSDGTAWYRVPTMPLARYLADLQPNRDLEGHAILRQGDLMLLDRKGVLRGFVIEDDDESIVCLHDGRAWVD